MGPLCDVAGVPVEGFTAVDVTNTTTLDVSEIALGVKAELRQTTWTGKQYTQRGEPDTGHWGAAWALLDKLEEMN